VRAARELGFECVDTYIPWSVHEDARGEFSFDGERDVQRFFDVCASEGMYVIARPGPHVNAELTEFGFPARIIRDERMQARTASGATAMHVIPPKVFPIISYASEAFYAEVELWYDAVCPIIARNQYPNGPVVLVQADNEHSYFFKLTPYDVDYSDSAIAHYRRVLEEKYGGIDALNAVYRAGFTCFDDIDPPRAFDAHRAADMPYYLDWAHAKERYLTDGVAHIASMLRARGITNVPISHNSPGAFGVPYNHVALENVIDVHGVDFYAHRQEYDYLKQSCLYLSGTARLAFIPEFGAGTWPWWPPIDDADVETNALTALMHGVKAINYYMLVERDRWLGSPIGRRGDVRERAAAIYRRLLEFVTETSWPSVDRQTDVLLLYVREYERLAFASHVVSPPFFPDVLGPLGDLRRHEVVADRTLGFAQPIQSALRRWTNDCARELSTHHFGYAIGDSESSLDRLRRFSTLVVPTFEFLTRATQEKLVAYARAGGRLLIGPELPRVDERGRACRVLAAADVRGIRLLKEPAELSQALVQSDIRPLAHLDNPDLDLALHAGGGSSYVFVANPTDSAQTGTIGIAAAELRDPWGTNDPLRGDGRFRLELAPYEIQVWSC
jgi:beta-galactosidase